MNLSARDVISAAPCPMALADNEGKIVLANDALLALSGYTREELAGKPIATFFEAGTATLLAKNGERIPVQPVSSPVNDADGRQEGTLLAVHSVRELQGLRDRLLQTGKLAAIGRLVGGIAHELNNPLAVILGFSQCSLQGMRQDDPLFEPLDSIEKEAQRCKVLIANLLAFSRAPRPGQEARDINESIDQVVSLLNARAKTKNVRIVRKLREGMPYIQLNSNQIKEVIVYLCNNAIDAMPGGGELTISADAQEDRVTVTIADTGTGLTEDVKKHLFEPFFTTKPAGEGIGLGLAVSKEIIEQHGGRIWAESEGPGKGSRFIFTLPLAK